MNRNVANLYQAIKYFLASWLKWLKPAKLELPTPLFLLKVLASFNFLHNYLEI